MKYLDICAGDRALIHINEHGFRADMFSTVLGASGGPKWFVLFGLDCFLFDEFFKQRTQPLHLLGSSAGAFRFAALAQKEPIAAIGRLASYYSQVVYSDKPTAQEISDKAQQVLDILLGEHGAQQIIENPTIHAHFITAHTSGLLSFDNKVAQLAGLTKSYLLNWVARKYLNKQYQRVIFGTAKASLLINDPHQIPSQYVKLDPRNIADAILASGSIPLVMSGVKDISGAPKGMYRDGGIIDYHFDFTVQSNTNDAPLVLYPHFSGNPKAGWFDKKLARTPHNSSFDNVVMLTPSEEFINMLPFKKIPDRDDFNNLDAPTRIDYWQRVLKMSELLSEDFAQFVAQPDLAKIKCLRF